MNPPPGEGRGKPIAPRQQQQHYPQPQQNYAPQQQFPPQRPPRPLPVHNPGERSPMERSPMERSPAAHNPMMHNPTAQNPGAPHNPLMGFAWAAASSSSSSSSNGFPSSGQDPFLPSPHGGFPSRSPNYPIGVPPGQDAFPPQGFPYFPPPMMFHHGPAPPLRPPQPVGMNEGDGLEEQNHRLPFFQAFGGYYGGPPMNFMAPHPAHPHERPPFPPPGGPNQPRFLDVRDLEENWERQGPPAQEQNQAKSMEAELNRLLGVGFDSPVYEETGPRVSLHSNLPTSGKSFDMRDVEAQLMLSATLAPVSIPIPQRAAHDEHHSPRGHQGRPIPQSQHHQQNQQRPHQGSPRRFGSPYEQGPSNSQRSSFDHGGRKPGRRTFPIIELYQSLIPPKEDIREREELFGRLQKIVNEVWPLAALHQYGSSANNLCLGKADMDLCLTIPEGEGDVEVLTHLAERLEKDDSYQNVKALTNTRVPIIKMKDVKSNISCDICFNNLLALYNTRMLKAYSKIDPRVHQLALVIKYWAKQRKINEPYFGTLSSYCLVLMLIFYLQNRSPAVLPCLQQIYGRKSPEECVVDVNGFNAYFFSDIEHLEDFGFRRGENGDDLYALLVGFFKFYGREFDYKSSVVCVRVGKVLTKEEKGWKIELTKEEKEEKERLRKERLEKREAERAQRLAAEAEKLEQSENHEDEGKDSEEEEENEEPADKKEDPEKKEEGEAEKQSKPKKPPMNRYWLCVEDPFEVTHNLGRVVLRNSLYDIKGEFIRAQKLLLQGEKMSVLCEPYKPKEKEEEDGGVESKKE